MLCIGTDVHAKLLTSYAVPLDMEDVEEKEFCDEFNREFKSTPADRQTMLRQAKWLQGWEHCILIENSTKTHDPHAIGFASGRTRHLLFFRGVGM